MLYFFSYFFTCFFLSLLSTLCVFPHFGFYEGNECLRRLFFLLLTLFWKKFPRFGSSIQTLYTLRKVNAEWRGEDIYWLIVIKQNKNRFPHRTFHRYIPNDLPLSINSYFLFFFIHFFCDFDTLKEHYIRLLFFLNWSA